MVTLLSLRREQQRFHADFEQQAVMLLNTLTASASDPLYNLDSDALEDVMSALGKANVVLGGRFYDRNGRVVADAHNEMEAFNLAADPLGVQFVQSNEIIFDWQPNQLIAGRSIAVGRDRLGAVSITLSTESLQIEIAEVRQQGFWAAGVAVGIGIMLGWLFSRSIVRPLRSLTEATQRIARGDLTQQITVCTRDEIELLGHAFNTMVGQVRTMIAQEEQQRVDLQEANQQLEQTLSELTEAEHTQHDLVETIRGLSIPILSVSPGIVLAPLIGALDAERSAQLLERMLEVVSERQGRVVIFDVTGMSVVDDEVANTILRTAHAARLIGAQTILCGIRPEVAQVLISLGVNLKDLRTTADLHSALAIALQLNKAMPQPAASGYIPR
jgi:anti-anti-sigma regulatory factor/HAMP domain-containing protein